MLEEDKWFYNKRKTDNFINDLERDAFVYRFFPLSRFMQILYTQELALVKFTEWDDPFENFVYSAQAVTESGIPIDLSNLRNCVFGQSWSLHQETDALWRIYSHDRSAVKVRVRAGNFFDALYGNGEDTALHLYFGKIMYKSFAEIAELMENRLAIYRGLFQKTDGAGMIEYMLVKRHEFSHENEARIILHTDTSDLRNKEKVIKFPFSPNEIFEEAILDPRLSVPEFDLIYDEIRAAGFAGEVRKSTLYDPPRFTLVLDM